MRQQRINGNRITLGLLLLAALINAVAHATVLPEERADVMYHEYDGDGITISGPSVLVRKNFLDKVSVSANYYVDNVTSASIDVRSYGSPYTEQRTETSIGADYLHEKSILSFSYTNSTENDYEANTYFFGISQDFFGDLTNIAIGFGIGDDEITETGDTSTNEVLDRQNFRLSISQILTKKLIMGINIETVSEEGFIQNPYRKSSILVSGNPLNRITSFVDESYPNTRTSDAVSIRLKYHLPYRAAVSTEFRYYSDSWDINGRNIELGYIHPLDSYPVTLDVKVRYYTQGDAWFYSDFLDLRDGEGVPDFHARDKELSQYSTTTYGVGAKWEFLPDGWSFIEKASVSLYYDYLKFAYDNFRDATDSIDRGATVGEEVLFEFDANVIRFYFTAVY